MYEYYYRNRPPSWQSIPDGFDPGSRQTWIPMKKVNGVYYLGTVSYPEPLSCEDLYRYELRPADQVEYAEYVFWQHRGSPIPRAEYLSADRALLEEYATRGVLAQAALIILDAQKESENEH